MVAEARDELCYRAVAFLEHLGRFVRKVFISSNAGREV